MTWYMNELVVGFQEMSVRLKVAVMLGYVCREERVGRSWRRCGGENLCDCLGCNDPFLADMLSFLSF